MKTTLTSKNRRTLLTVLQSVGEKSLAGNEITLYYTAKKPVSDGNIGKFKYNFRKFKPNYKKVETINFKPNYTTQYVDKISLHLALIKYV